MIQTFQKGVSKNQLSKEWTDAYIQQYLIKEANVGARTIQASLYYFQRKVLVNKIKLEEEMENKIGDEQARFTAGKSCIEKIYIVQQLIEKKIAKTGLRFRTEN